MCGARFPTRWDQHALAQGRLGGGGRGYHRGVFRIVHALGAITHESGTKLLSHSANFTPVSQRDRRSSFRVAHARGAILQIPSEEEEEEVSYTQAPFLTVPNEVGLTHCHATTTLTQSLTRPAPRPPSACVRCHCRRYTHASRQRMPTTPPPLNLESWPVRQRGVDVSASMPTGFLIAS